MAIILPMLTFGDLRDACRGAKLVWTINRGSGVWGLHDLFSETAVVCTDDSPEFDGTEVTFLTHEGLSGRRPYWSSETESLLKDAWQQADGLLCGTGWTVLAPAGCLSAREWASRSSSRIVDAPRLACDLTDKRALFAVLEDAGLPQIAGEWISLDSGQSFRAWAARFGTPLVVQATQGQGGSGTLFVRTEAEWVSAADQLSGGPVRIAPFAGTLSVNINALALKGASRAGSPSVQLTGFGFLNATEGGYCGNDFSAAALLPPPVLGEVREQTERIGDAIAKMGFRGLYGLDFVVDDGDGRPKAVDLNPRMQGSTALAVQAERCASRTPLAAVALLVEAGLLEPEEAVRPGDEFFHCVSGAQVRVRAAAECRRCGQVLAPGSYTMRGEWRREGRMLEQIHEDEVLLTGAPPRPETWIEGGSQLFRVYSRGGMVEPGSFAPAAWVRGLIERLTNGSSSH